MFSFRFLSWTNNQRRVRPFLSQVFVVVVRLALVCVLFCANEGFSGSVWWLGESCLKDTGHGTLCVPLLVLESEKEKKTKKEVCSTLVLFCFFLLFPTFTFCPFSSFLFFHDCDPVDHTIPSSHGPVFAVILLIRFFFFFLDLLLDLPSSSPSL